jgi:hypothetical protein
VRLFGAYKKNQTKKIPDEFCFEYTQTNVRREENIHFRFLNKKYVTVNIFC